MSSAGNLLRTLRTLCARCHDDRSAEERRRRGAAGWQKHVAPPDASARPAGMPRKPTRRS
jgi:hypothetical protein